MEMGESVRGLKIPRELEMHKEFISKEEDEEYTV